MKQTWFRRGNKAASVTEQDGIWRVSLWYLQDDQPSHLLAFNSWKGKTLRGAQKFYIRELGGEKPWEIRAWTPGNAA